tara:strand:+ start:791 stop:1447 length:657 start_codon:yes stop_codon:yes gene_type:complete
MKVNIDTMQRIKGGGIFMLEFYKILMGTFLTIFVPRDCGSRVCTLTDNYKDDEIFHRCVFILNCVSFFTVMVLYYSEIKRENWCITYLDIDENKSLENLDTEIERYPEIKKNMTKLNKQYRNAAYICIGMQFVNIVLSCVDILSNHAGNASLTPMISYIMLIMMKLYNSYFISLSSIKKERAFSAYLKGPKTYNAIDLDHRHPDDIIEVGEVELTVIS